MIGMESYQRGKLKVKDKELESVQIKYIEEYLMMFEGLMQAIRLLRISSVQDC